MADWLFKFGIGGVQEFIGQSRKLRDLAAGSRIIENCAQEAHRIATLSKASLRLPAQLNGTGSCPHQLVFHVQKMEKSEVKQFGDSLIAGVREHWRRWVKNQLDEWRKQELADHIVKEARNCDLASNALLRNHVEAALELYWVAVPVADGDKKSFERLLKLYDDRRNTRTFKQLSTYDPGSPSWSLTCSLCGIRPSILQPPKKGWPVSRVFVSGAEKLCVVCVARRWFALDSKETEHIPSTHRLSLARFFIDPSLARTREQCQPDVWEDVLDHFDELTERKRREDVAAPEAKSQNAKKNEEDLILRLLPCFAKLCESAREYRKVCELPKYYAIVVFDGDEMGKWFSADGKLVNPDSTFGQVRETLSKAILSFGSRVRGRVETLFGTTAAQRAAGPRVVYIGGDDGLVLCSLDALFPLLEAIRREWCVAMDEMSRLGVNGKRPTLTLHASVEHAKSPLQPAMSRAYAMLKSAKEPEGTTYFEGRNCFSLMAAPHSGAPSRMLAEWNELESLVKSIQLLTNWRCGMLEPVSSGSAFSSRLPFSILEALPGFFEPKGREYAPVGGCFGRELDRLFGQSDSKKSAGDWPTFRNWLVQRAEGGGSPVRAIFHGRESVQDALTTVSFLARVLNWNTAQES